MQYKIKVQRNIETVCLLSKKPWFSAVCRILRGENECVFSGLLNETFEYWNSGVVWNLPNNRLLLKGITFSKMYDTSRQEPFYIKITWLPNLTDVIFTQVQKDCGWKFFTTKSYTCNKRKEECIVRYTKQSEIFLSQNLTNVIFWRYSVHWK